MSSEVLTCRCLISITAGLRRKIDNKIKKELASSSMDTGGDKEGKISKLATLIAKKADKIADRISHSISGSHLRSSSGLSSRHSSSGSLEPADNGSQAPSARTSSHGASTSSRSVFPVEMMAAAAAATAAAAAASKAHDAPPAVSPAAEEEARSKSRSVGSVGGGLDIGSLPPLMSSDPDPDPTDPPLWGSDSLGLHEFEGRPSRKGIYLQLLGEQVEIIGEKGTKVTPLSFDAIPSHISPRAPRLAPPVPVVHVEDRS